MILVYANKSSSRLTYTLDVVFQQILQINYKLVDLKAFSADITTPRLNYSNIQIDDCLQIIPHSLLFETVIEAQNIKIEWEDTTPCFFKTTTTDIKYDILAATFYMISRYEEYLPTTLDSHNRFKAENTLAYQNNFLDKPVVNIWILKLKAAFQSKYPTLKFPKQEYKYINTLDIDIAYAYKGKNLLRILSSTFQSILKDNQDDLKHRFNYFFKNEKDPYDVYSKIAALNTKHNTKSIFFFLLGNYGTYDKNLAHSTKAYTHLIQKISASNSTGIHPSYNSNTDLKQVSIEKERLASITGTSIQKSRQHFLKLVFPATYENLISAGIKEDYSMGFASKIGFRAGICSPYSFFNLQKNQAADLKIIPFQIMDGTLREYLKLSPKEAITEIQKMVSEIKKVNGLFVSLWHNSSISKLYWNDWILVYEELLKTATETVE